MKNKSHIIVKIPILQYLEVFDSIRLFFWCMYW